MIEHPINKIISRMDKSDLQIADVLIDAGFSDEDLYAALPNQKDVELLTKKPERSSTKKVSKAMMGEQR